MVTIYHNPNCSKSVKALKIIQNKGIKPEVIKYLGLNLSVEELKELTKTLNLYPSDIVRKKEVHYKSLVEKYGDPSEVMILTWIVKFPVLLQRPIVVTGSKAIIARPPELVLEIL